MKIEKYGLVMVNENAEILVKDWNIEAEGASGNECIIHILTETRKVINQEIKRWRDAEKKRPGENV